MAKYLGGINAPDIEVVEVTEVNFLDFEIVYDDKKDPDDLKTISIYDNLDRYEVISAEKVHSSDYSLTWGLAGYLTGGPLWGIIGAILGGDSSTEIKNRIVFCSLKNGWQFALELDNDEFESWKIYMESALEED